MNTAPLTFQATSFKGEPTTILAQQTGPDALSLHIIGGGSNTYQITGVRRVAEGVYEGETSVLMQTPHIRLEVGNGVTITITHTWWNPAPIRFLLSADKATEVNAWLDAAKFPQV
jgi:hypothetical protein